MSLSHLALVHCSLLASRAGVVSAAQAFQPGRRSIEAGPSTTEVLNVTYFNEVQRGGHFAAWEEPQLFSEELRAAFSSLR